jgi:putative peptide zinc metalloprotease protein
MSSPLEKQPDQNSASSSPAAQDPWRQFVLTLRPGLKFEKRTIKGAQFVVIEDVARGKFFQVGMGEYDFVAAVDGKASVEQIAIELNASVTGQGSDVEALDLLTQRGVTVAQWLVQSNLAYSDAMDSSVRLNAQQRSLNRAKLMGWVNPISFKTKLFNPNRLLDTLQPWCHWCFHWSVLMIWLVLAAMSGWIVLTRWSELGSASAGILSGGRWIWMIGLWLALKVIHELAHGIACKRYGGDVPEAGVLFLLFTPMAYVNVTSMWRFSNRWQRIIVAAAGMYVELMISFVALIVWSKSSGLVADIAFQTFLMASVTTILFNANPLMRFDGYFILSDLLNIPNLYTKGTKWFADRMKSLFFGLPIAKNICVKDELRIVAGYGCLAFFWKISISVGLVIASSVLFQGAGIILAAVGVVLWFGMPLFQQYQQLFGAAAKHPINRSRTMFSCGLSLILLVGMFTFFRAPAIKSAPAIVQFGDETVIRAGADGFVREILVEDGQAVSAGETMIVMSNPQLSLEVDRLLREATEAKIQSRIHQQKQETSLAQSQLNNYASLMNQATEKQKQVDNLIVRADFDGFVFRRGLKNSINRFSKRGDPLLTLARRDRKEVVISVDQKDIESLRENEDATVRVVVPGIQIFESKINKIDPTASSTPSHLSLCAHVNGPLPVRSTASGDESNENGSSMELLSPRLTATLELDSSLSKRVRSGQIGRAFFKAQSQSLGVWLFLAANEWLTKQFEQASQTAVF